MMNPSSAYDKQVIKNEKQNFCEIKGFQKERL